ncbi:MAG: GNAT family N-acetyltransferase, partial [Parachlamydiaceae bacterium]
MKYGFEVVLPTKEHASIVCALRNDPEVRKNSFTYTEPKTPEAFYPEFLRTHFSHPKLLPLFVWQENKRIALLRFDPECEISIVLDAPYRGKGLGSEVLTAVEPLLIREGVSEVVARIKTGNEASVKTFEKAGYVQTQSGPDYLTFKRALGSNRRKVFIIAEAGSNWKAGTFKEDLEQAYQLIQAAKESGADAVKFQTFRKEQVYVPNPGQSDYLSKAGIQEDIGELFKELEMPDEMIPLLAKRAKEVGIEWMSSVFSERDFAEVDPYVKRHKIASYEISHPLLLTLAAKSGKPLILSTGASQPSDIDWACDIFFKEGGKDLTLLQCTACYPAPPEGMNLKVIPWLQQRYQVASGLSDHSEEVSTAAV